ncbi:MAG TPA: hypothetical protein VE553_10435 [Candidatus Binatia bacterium]|jgi:proteasome lid subunit RPN8/RPN11|nr:hypothetical protein [Candidatus Binatia bacterium]
MLEVSELTYAAIITVELPGMSHPATVTLTLTPPDVLETAPGEYKALRDCTLADIQAFADALESTLWQAHQDTHIRDLVADDSSPIKITLINESGKALALTREQVLAHAIRVADTAPAAAPETDARPLPEESAHDQRVEETAAREVEEVLPPAAPERQPEDETEPDAGAQAPPVDEALYSREEEAVEETAKEPAVAAPVRELRIAGLRRPLRHPTPAAVDILINEPAMRDAQAHALSSMDREVAGMLVGPRPEKQPDGRYVVHITDIIIALHTRMMGASVTYTPESWRYVSDKLQEKYPDEEAVFVGWYHTHPGFGIFLSGMDLFIHQNFFTQLWHVALVLDPRAARMGFFCWDRQQSEVRPYEFPWPSWAANAW